MTDAERELPPPIPGIPGHEEHAVTDLWGRSTSPKLLTAMLDGHQSLLTPRSRYFAGLTAVYSRPDDAHQTIVSRLPDETTVDQGGWAMPLKILTTEIGTNPLCLGPMIGAALQTGPTALNIFAYRQARSAVLNSRALPYIVQFFWDRRYRLSDQFRRNVTDQRRRDRVAIPPLASEPLGWLYELPGGKALPAAWYSPTHDAYRVILGEYAKAVRARLGAAMPHVYVEAAQRYVDRFLPTTGFRQRHIKPLRRAIRTAMDIEQVMAYVSQRV